MTSLGTMIAGSRGRGVALCLAIGLTQFLAEASTAADSDFGLEVLTGQAYQWDGESLISRGPWTAGSGVSYRVTSFDVNLPILDKPREVIVKAILFGAFGVQGSDAGLEDAAKQSLSGPQAGGGAGLETASDQSVMLLYSRLFDGPWGMATGHALIVAYSFELF